MELTWSWWGVPGGLAFVISWSAAVFVLRTVPARSVNRRLAVVLLLEGLYVGCNFGFLFFFGDPRLVSALAVLGTASMAALPFQYVGFLGSSLRIRLVAAFRSGRAALVLSGLSAGAAGWVILAGDRFVTGLYQPGWAPWNFQVTDLGIWVLRVHGLASLFGLGAAVVAYRRAAVGTGERTQARWFVIAFGLRDAWLGIVQFLYPVLRPIPFWGDLVYNPLTGSVYLASVVLLAYGVLLTQLFEIELKVKFAIEQSTVGAAIAGAFFIGSEILEAFVPVQGTILGVISALAIVSLLKPLRRGAERFSGRLMHGVEATPDYLGRRKLLVYESALSGAIEDGVVTDKERAILLNLRTELGIDEKDASAIERRLGVVGPDPIHAPEGGADAGGAEAGEWPNK